MRRSDKLKDTQTEIVVLIRGGVDVRVWKTWRWLL